MGAVDKRTEDPTIRDRAIAAYQAGDTIAAIREAIKVNPKTLYRWFQDAGVYEPRRKKPGRRNMKRLQRELKVARDYQLGEKVEAIALVHNIPRDRVTFIARRAGLPPRTKSSALTRRMVRLKMQLYDDDQLAKLKANWVDPNTFNVATSTVRPVVKLVLYDCKGCWLLAMVNPDDPDVAYGLCDNGTGNPKLQYILLSDLRKMQGPWGLRVERDLYFQPTKALIDYAEEARRVGQITFNDATSPTPIAYPPIKW